MTFIKTISGKEIRGHNVNAAGYISVSLFLPEYGISLGINLNSDDGLMMVINDLLNIVIDYLEKKPLSENKIDALNAFMP